MGLGSVLGGLIKAGLKGGGKKGRGGSRGGSASPLDSILPGGLGALTGGNAGLLKVLLPMLLGGAAAGRGGGLGGLGGGLGGLLEQLGKGGLGGKANSWVGVGANEAVSPDELEAALGRDEVARVAREAGVSHDEAKSGLATLLPSLVDKVTPEGRVPDAGSLAALVKGLDVRSLL